MVATVIGATVIGGWFLGSVAVVIARRHMGRVRWQRLFHRRPNRITTAWVDRCRRAVARSWRSRGASWWGPVVGSGLGVLAGQMMSGPVAAAALGAYGAAVVVVVRRRAQRRAWARACRVSSDTLAALAADLRAGLSQDQALLSAGDTLRLAGAGLLPPASGGSASRRAADRLCRGGVASQRRAPRRCAGPARCPSSIYRSSQRSGGNPGRRSAGQCGAACGDARGRGRSRRGHRGRPGTRAAAYHARRYGALLGRGVATRGPRVDRPVGPHRGGQMNAEPVPLVTRSRRGAGAIVRWCAGSGAPGGVAGLVIAESLWGATVGLAFGIACGWWLAHRPTSADRAVRRQVDADLPFAAELIAAALRAGAAPDAAVRVVAEAVGGPVGLRLARVERALRLGAPAAEAWSYLGDDDGAIRFAHAAQRTDHSGAALAGALVRIADDLRTDSALATEAAARRAGVLIVLPLGLCFLPAFMLTGLVPVIVAVIGGVLSASP